MKEIPGKLRFLFSFDREVNDCTSRMERFNNFVFVVAGKDEPAVVIKRLNICP
jgi:hypothetical protein